MKKIFAVSVLTLSLLGGAQNLAFAATEAQIASAESCVANSGGDVTGCLPLLAVLTPVEFRALAARTNLSPELVAQIEDSVEFATGDVGAPPAAAPAAGAAPAGGAPESFGNNGSGSGTGDAPAPVDSSPS